eukprot:2743285-Pyramimonas_sp.AAC.1
MLIVSLMSEASASLDRPLSKKFRLPPNRINLTTLSMHFPSIKGANVPPARQGRSRQETTW